MEFAEGRANLNKEQAFYYLSLYQYSVSRQQLQAVYQNATTEKHPDVSRNRAMDLIKDGFSYFTTPILPENHLLLQKETMQSSKPYKILHDFSTIE